MESIGKKHFTDLAKGLAYYVLATLSEFESKDRIDPNYLTDIVIDRLQNLCCNRQLIEKWSSDDSLKESVLAIFKDNLRGNLDLK